MNPGSIRLDGMITFWSAASFYSRSQLKTSLAALGLEPFAPHQSTYDANLRYSLARVFNTGEDLIRSNKGGFCVLREVRGEREQSNDYVSRYTFWLDGPEHNKLMMRPVDQGVGEQVARVFNEFCGLVTHHAVTKMLTALLARLGGVPLRPTGAVYWLPAQAESDWQAISQAVESAAAHGHMAVYLIRHQFDQDSVRAVRDALISEAEAEAERIEREVMSEELGARALETRKASANQVIDKLTDYERLLDTTLQGVKSRLETVLGLASVAALRAAAAQYEEVPSE